MDKWLVSHIKVDLTIVVKSRVMSSLMDFLCDISSNDILGFYMDLDNGNLKVYKNGSDFMGSELINQVV